MTQELYGKDLAKYKLERAKEERYQKRQKLDMPVIMMNFI